MIRGKGGLSEMDAIEVCDGYVRRKGHLSNICVCITHIYKEMRETTDGMRY